MKYDIRRIFINNLRKDGGFGKRTLSTVSVSTVRYHEAGHATAALTLGIPIITVTIENDRPHLLRGRYRAHDANFGLEALVTLCLAGPEAEEEFCGPINDDSDRADYEMARGYLARQFEPLRAAAELVRCRMPHNAWSARRGRKHAFG